jgi:hypothetical protein
MSGYVLHEGALVLCSHPPGVATPDNVSSRVTVSGHALVTVFMQYTVSGCALTGSSPNACTRGTWIRGASRVTADNMPVALDSGSSMCLASFEPLDPKLFQRRVTAS